MRDARAVCASCGRALCESCWRRTVNRQPWCELCIHRLKSSGRSVAVAVLFVLLSVSAATTLWRGQVSHHQDLGLPFWITYAVLTVAGAIWFGARKPRPMQVLVEPRQALAGNDAAPGRSLRRSSVKASINLVASPLSGLWTSTLLTACMITVAFVVPRLLYLPRWVEAEWVVLVWWLLWVTLLTVLLYRGWRISDDHVLALPQRLWDDEAPNPTGEGAVPRWLRFGCDPTLGLGCGELGVAVLVVGALFFVSWFVIELVVPCLFFLAYFLVRSSLARVANDRHLCEGRIDKSLSLGLLWASLYAAPLATAIALTHVLVRHR